MLTLYDFNGMRDNEKAEAVWQGNFLADRIEAGFRVQLYGLDNFYVEVFYDPEANRIERFRAFTSKNLLVPYLEQIRIIL